jgi:glycosyltransferase involved in cell wall biosynthesis
MVSVVVPVYNGAQTVGETVECLLRQSYAPHQIIVVDDGSTDATLEVLKRYTNQIIIISKKNGGPASARNCGIRLADSRYIAFTDSDCIPKQNWLAELLKGFDNSAAAGVGGKVYGADTGLVCEYIDVIGSLNPIIKAGEIHSFATANVCFRRDVLFEVGLFDERFKKPGGEDTELCIRIRAFGYKFRVAEEAIVLHHHRQTVRAFLRTVANYGEGNYLLGKTWPEESWKADHRRELIRSAIALRSMLKKCRVHKPQFGFKRALLFSLLDHYKNSAFAWGYLRGERAMRVSKE